MRIVLVLIAVALLLVESGSTVKPATAVKPSADDTATTSNETARVDFDTQVKPIFKSQCTPCHSNGGQMYDKLPFDKPETIRKLGVKVFTRIKGPDDRKLIEAFLTQQP